MRGYLLMFLPLAGATQVANLDVTESVATNYDCNPTCYSNLIVGLLADQQFYGALYDDAFYDTAANFTGSNPGDILKFEPVNATNLQDIPDGASIYRFQYVTEKLDGTPVPATAFIAFPFSNTENGHTYKTIAFAHGTSGVFRGCAPSAMPNLYDYGTWSRILTRGYAVIATDYAGLGNNYTGHQYSASPAQANDVFYSVVAARKVFGQHLTKEWMSVGHSEGGGAVWALAESHHVQSSPCSLSAAGQYLGTVAHAPDVRVKEMALLAAQLSLSSSDLDVSSSRGTLAELGYLVFGLSSIHPEMSLSWLQPEYRRRLDLMNLTQACFESAEALVADLTIDQVANLSDPTLFTAFDVMQNLTARGNAKSHEPILVIQGLNDVSVLPQMVVESYNASCEAGNVVHLQVYSGLGHGQILAASAPYFLQWIDDQFEGRGGTENCTKTTVEPFDAVDIFLSDNAN